MEKVHSDDRFVQLYADCVTVDGAKMAAIYDLTRQEIFRFPQEYLAILQRLEGGSLASVLAEMDDEANKQAVRDFYDFLVSNELVNLSVSPHKLPKIGGEWETPCVIQNAIIDIKTQRHDFARIFQQLDLLGCELVQIRAFSNLYTLAELRDILRLAYHTSMQGVELLIKYDRRCSDDDYLYLMEQEPIVSRLTVHSAPSDKDLVTDFGAEMGPAGTILKQVTLTERKLTSEHHCGEIREETLTLPTVRLFLEHKKYNGCLNRKISIDADGLIKHCPSMATSYGHHKLQSLVSVAYEQEFQRLWNINKDSVPQCRRCEFRYACTDCRAYLEQPDNEFSKPLKCGYNPNTALWESWESAPQKRWPIRHYESTQGSHQSDCQLM